MAKMSPPLLGVIGGALLGTVVAQGLAPNWASACSCAPHEWVYNLAATDAPDGAAEHAAYWPSQISVQASEAAIFIESHLLDRADEPEALERVSGVSR